MGKRMNGMDKESTTKKVSKKIRLSDAGHGAKQRVAEVGDVGVNLDEELIPIKQFPIEIFPTEFQDFVTDVATCFNVEEGLVASMAMTVLSGAIGNTVKISVKASQQTQPFLWLVVIGRTGTGKSPPMDALLDYIKRLQSKANQESTQTTYITNDCSVAALADILATNRRGIIVHRDEISGLILGFDQYKGDRERYLELFRGQPWFRNRKNVSKDNPNPGVAIIGGIQPKILPKVFGDDTFDDGLFPRFLPYPLEERPLRFNRADVTDEHRQYWAQLLDRCYRIPLKYDEDGFVKPMRNLRLDAKALDLYASFFNRYGQFGMLLSTRAEGLLIKLLGYYLPKFAGLLHIITMLNKGKVLGFLPINGETMSNAIKLMEFFAGQAMKTLRLYKEKGSSLNELQIKMVMSLKDLEGEVKNGKLKLKKIMEAFNEALPDINLGPEATSSMLRKMGLKTDTGTAGYSYLIWEPEKINALFSRIDSNNYNYHNYRKANSSEKEEVTEKRRRIPIVSKKSIAKKK